MKANRILLSKIQLRKKQEPVYYIGRNGNKIRILPPINFEGN